MIVTGKIPRSMRIVNPEFDEATISLYLNANRPPGPSAINIATEYASAGGLVTDALWGDPPRICRLYKHE